MRQRIISAAVGAFLCVVATTPAMAQGAADSGGIVQAVYGVLTSWIGDLSSLIDDRGLEAQAAEDERLAPPPDGLLDGPGIGPEMSPIIVPTG